MVARHFAHIDTWVFDLDNTLYPPEANLFGLMDVRFAAYVKRVTGLGAAAAQELAVGYWRTHGSTLIGLMADYDVDPHDFLADVHDIDISHLAPDPSLQAAMGGLKGRKIVYTNGSRNHAKRVLAARGLTAQFDAVYGTEDAGFQPKPTAAAFQTIFAKDGVVPERAAMFEDELRNLEVPYQLGMRTVHVHGQSGDSAHVHHHAPDLPGFLSQVIG